MGMVKVVNPAGWDFDRPIARQIKVGRDGLRGQDRKDLIKMASPSFVDMVDQVKLAEGDIPIHLIALGASEYYGCFLAGTPVRMADASEKPIEEVLLGDKVVNRRGEVDEVVTTYERPYDGPGIRMKVEGLVDAVTCTDGHEFYVIPREQVACEIDKAKKCTPDTCQQISICHERNCAKGSCTFDPEKRHARDLRPGDYVMQAVPTRGVGKQTWKWSDSLASVVGYFLAEGSFIKSENGQLKGLSISHGIQEADTVVADCLNVVEGLKIEYENLRVNGPYNDDDERGTCTIKLYDDNLAKRLYSCVGEYSNGKDLHGEVFSQDTDRLTRMIAAYVDGDGTRDSYVRHPGGREEGRYTCGTSSLGLAKSLQWILGKLGVAASVCQVSDEAIVRRNERDGKSSGPFWHVSWTNRAGQFLKGRCRKYKETPAHQRKQRSFHWNGYICRPIREVEECHVRDTVYDLEVKNDHTYTVFNGIAVSNSNRNGDGFKEATCREHHDTFVKSARWYRNHQNKDPNKSYGFIKASDYNEPMHRVELLAILNGNEKAARRNGGYVADKELEKLARDEDIPVSMACRVPHDICSNCGNVARSPAEYCTEETCVGPDGEKRGGCKHNLTKVGADGHILHVDNPNPHWFDMSNVFRPADRIAYGNRADYLEKAASAAGAVGGAKLAEELGVSAPLQVMFGQEHPNWMPDRIAGQVKLAYALAAIEQQEPGSQPKVASDSALQSLHPELQTTASQQALTRLGNPGTQKAAERLATLADSKLILSLRDFACWMDKESAADRAAPLIPGIFNRLVHQPGLEQRLQRHPGMVAEKSAGGPAYHLTRELYSSHSLDREAVSDRASRAAVRGLNTPNVKSASGFEKSASDDSEAVELAESYGLYKLAALHRMASFDSDFNLTARLAVAHNRVSG